MIDFIIKTAGILLACGCVSCSPFSEIASDTKFDTQDGYIKVYNSKIALSSRTFRDFKFATNDQQFKQLNKAKPAFKNILVYAKTTDVPYDYYILHKPKKPIRNDSYVVHDTTIANTKLTIAIAAHAPPEDIKFIMSNFGSEQ